MLDYTGDVETDFLCHFSFGYTDVFGANLTHVLKENGDNIPVTNKNREVRIDKFLLALYMYSTYGNLSLLTVFTDFIGICELVH